MRRFAVHLFFLFFIGLNFRLVQEKHIGWEYPDYHHFLVSDMAGYYVYLPSFFIYDFRAADFPAEAIKNSGEGFRFSQDGSKVITKYPCGTAILESPFFLLVHFREKYLNHSANGFGAPYQNVPLFAAAFYLFAGLILLSGFLRKFVSLKTAYLTAFVTGFGTHLSWFAFDHPGMSHVYSFFLFSAALYLVAEIQEKNKPDMLRVTALSCLAALILLTRPSNGIILLLLLFWNMKPGSRSIARIVVNSWYLIPAAFCFVLVLTPQFLYWKYAFGSGLKYSYEGESFSNILMPQFIEVLFPFGNGLLPNAPFWILILVVLMISAFRKDRNARVLLAFFIVLTWIISAWHDPYYGCSFGSRPFAEYGALFCLPVALLFEKGLNANLWKKIMVSSLVVVLVAFHMKVLWDFEGCWNGNSGWDIREYVRTLFVKTYYMKDDFERSSEKTVVLDDRGENHYVLLNDKKDATEKFAFNPERWSYFGLRRIRYGFDVQFSNPSDTLLVVIYGTNPGGKPFWGSNAISPSVIKPAEWHKASGYMNIHQTPAAGSLVYFFFWRPRGGDIKIDNLKIMAH